MDETIRPRRSMSRSGFGVLIGIIAFFNLVVAVLFVVMGAKPIPIFLGLDVLLIWLAFRASFKAAENGERVRVSAETVEVTREGPKSAKTVWSSPTAFTRVAVEDISEHEWRVRLHLSGKYITLARTLGPEQRQAFGRALEAAVRAARKERYPAQEAGGLS